jgi:dephospho-CoA kinase
MKPFTVGLTGGIGSGKSTVAKLFEEHGGHVVDTDAIAHALTAPGGAAIEPIRRQFGQQFICADGSLDRAAMRQLVFSDANAKAELENILHPPIRAQVASELQSCAAPYVILVVPLLIETGASKELIDRTLVVDCEEALQIQRSMARSRLSHVQVLAIMNTQASRAERLKHADDIITNNGAPEDLVAQVKQLDLAYRARGQTKK